MTNQMSKEKQTVSIAWDEVRVGIVQILLVSFAIFAVILAVVLPFALVGIFYD